MCRIKKIISLILSISILLVCLAVSQVSVAAAGGSLGGTQTVRAGDTISVTLYAQGPDVYGCEASFSYDTSVLTYKSYKKNTSWSNFSFNAGSLSVVANDTSQSKPISSSGSIVTLTFKVANNLPVGTNVSVKVSGKVSTLSNGSFKSASFGGTYSKKVASPLSTNARLSSLTVSNASISPAFSPDVNSYSCSVPFGVQSLDINAKAQDASAKVTVSNNSLTAGSTTNVTISVKAPSGSVNTYTIKATRAQDPNYVPDSNGTLSSLVVDGFSISPAFSPDVKEYVVWLPNEVSSIDVYCETASNKSTVTVSENKSALAVGDNLISISVTAENKDVTEYTLLAVRNSEYISYESYLNGKSQHTVADDIVSSEMEDISSSADKLSDNSMPMWGFVLICFFCLIAGFFGCLMIPRKKIDENKEDLFEDDIEETNSLTFTQTDDEDD